MRRLTNEKKLQSNIFKFKNCERNHKVLVIVIIELELQTSLTIVTTKFSFFRSLFTLNIFSSSLIETSIHIYYKYIEKLGPEQWCKW